jgi:hypothetical protein
VAQGFGSVICCVNDAYLDQSFLGRNIDAEFVNDLPEGVDPCGKTASFIRLLSLVLFLRVLLASK